MHHSENNFAFIDSQNINLGIKSLGWTLDFRRFRIFLRDKYHVTQAFLFIGYVPGNERLYAALQSYGYICIFKPTLQLANKQVKGNVDAELVLHTMIHSTEFDKAVIVSGDGDFYCLAEHLLQEQKLLKILVPNYRYSSLLKKLNTSSLTMIDILSEHRKKLEYHHKEKGSERDLPRSEPISS
ncbi:MAG: NYN domain-containing protein [Candidatus Kerfeldbacteria bacterium]|nr:NYN domain-containing protein [Candidatus Kerfeldbacteria bacterium]